MLKKFRVNNFKSLVNVELEPTGLNLLIGPNNAGKTNLSAAMWFLGLSASHPLQTALFISLKEAFRVTNVYVSDATFSLEMEVDLFDKEEELHFIYSLTAGSPQSPLAAPPAPYGVLNETLRLTGGGFRDALLIDNNEGRVRLLHEKRYLAGSAGDLYVETSAPADATMLMRLYDLDTNKRANLFKSYLKRWSYYNLNTLPLRSPKGTVGSYFLGFDGSNLGAALHSLHNQNPRVERKLIEIVRQLEPKLDAFTFFTPDQETVYWYMEDSNGNRFGVNSISDGTILYLALALIVLDGRYSHVNSPVIIIEEPENGIYVGYLKDLIDMIDRTGKSGQFIFTSHNPYFIDRFDEHLEGVFYMKPGVPSSTILRPDKARLQKLLEEMPLGELHFRELIA